MQILVSLRVHRTESQYFYLYRYRLGLCLKKYLYEKTKRRQSLASILSASKNHCNFYLVSFRGLILILLRASPSVSYGSHPFPGSSITQSFKSFKSCHSICSYVINTFERFSFGCFAHFNDVIERCTAQRIKVLFLAKTCRHWAIIVDLATVRMTLRITSFSPLSSVSERVA